MQEQSPKEPVGSERRLPSSPLRSSESTAFCGAAFSTWT